jgi:AcrR family transcriptional regulator
MSTTTFPIQLSFVSERPYHHGNLRSALLEQAESILRDQGAEQISLRELARQVGVSHAAPRRHFQDRQALLDAIAENGFARLGTELSNAFTSVGDSFAPRVRALAAAYVRFATDDAALLELMFGAKSLDPDGPMHDAAMAAFDPVFELIAQGQAEGRLESGDPERVGMVLFASIQGAAALFTAGMIERAALDQLTVDAITYFLRGAQPAQTS